jgi:hypothetical protein
LYKQNAAGKRKNSRTAAATDPTIVPIEIREDLPLFASTGFVGAFELVPFTLDPALFPPGGTGETGLLGVEPFAEGGGALEPFAEVGGGPDPFGDGDGGLPEGGGTEGLAGGSDNDLSIRGFPPVSTWTCLENFGIGGLKLLLLKSKELKDFNWVRVDGIAPESIFPFNLIVLSEAKMTREGDIFPVRFLLGKLITETAPVLHTIPIQEAHGLFPVQDPAR